MLRANQVSDKDLLKRINARLGKSGLGGQSHVQVVVRNGEVTLSGNIQYDMQRQTVLNAIRGVGGVRRVGGQVQVKNTRGRVK